MLDWIFPQTITTINSEINGEMKVVKSRGRYSVWAGGFQQSGPLVEKMWQKALNSVAIEQCNHVLVLGLGCGSAVKPLRKKFPACYITGVEIDPVMLALGRKYFHLAETSNLKLALVDALRCFETSKYAQKKFDLILVDLYCGGGIPKQAQAKQFRSRISAVLTSRGTAIFNYLYNTGAKKARRAFVDSLEKYFQIGKTLEQKSGPFTNLLIFCSPA